MKATVVRHRTRAARGAVNVDRRSRWGNPFQISPAHDRDDVVSRHAEWMWGRLADGDREFLRELASLHGKKLACWCAPKRCHADNLVEGAAYAHETLKTGMGV